MGNKAAYKGTERDVPEAPEFAFHAGGSCLFFRLGGIVKALGFVE